MLGVLHAKLDAGLSADAHNVVPTREGGGKGDDNTRKVDEKNRGKPAR